MLAQNNLEETTWQTLTHPVKIIVKITRIVCAILLIMSPYGSFTKPMYNINWFKLQCEGDFTRVVVVLSFEPSRHK